MKHLFLLIALVLPKLMFAQENQPSGWGNAKWGMVDSQIVVSFQNVAKLKSPKEFTSGTAYYSIERLTIAGCPFQVYFVMDSTSHKLTMVEMKYSGSQPFTSFDGISKELIGKYGEPTTKDESEEGHKAWNWIFPRTEIELGYLNIASINIEQLWVRYIERKSGESGF